MANKPTYKMAHDLRKAQQGGGTIEVEGAIDATKPAPHTESLVPPKKSGMPDETISPEPKAGQGWRSQVKSGIAHPGDTTADHSDVIKT